jgi:hypothetical protein
VLRVGGEGRDQIQEFSVYSPKIVALIGDLDGVLADRCLPVQLKRKTGVDEVEQYRSRVVEPIGRDLSKEIEKWALAHSQKVADVFDCIEPFPIQNDRMAELLLPLQAVLTVADPGLLPSLEQYADALDAKDREAERMSPGVRLLTACREIFQKRVKLVNGVRFVPTNTLITYLTQRDEEPWAHFTRGRNITPEALANLLRPYGIRSKRNAKQTARGFFAHDFAEAFGRYLSEKPV